MRARVGLGQAAAPSVLLQLSFLSQPLGSWPLLAMDLPPLPLQPACLFPGADRGAPSSAGSVLFCRVINRWSVLIFQPPERILAAAPSFREQGAWCLSCPDKDQPIPKISLSCHYPSLSGWPSQPTVPASPAPGSSLPRVWTRFLSSPIATVLQPSQRPGAPSREGPWPSSPSHRSFKTDISIAAR